MDEGKAIASALVEQRLAACVNLIPSIQSTYWWEGKIETSEEVLLVAKTEESRFPAFTDAVKRLHSYDVPEIIALPIEAGHMPYLRWVTESLRR